MRITTRALILSVGPIKDNKGFKKCYVIIETLPLRDVDTDEVIRDKEAFECELAIRNDKVYQELQELAKPYDNKSYLPMILDLRSFYYQEKNQRKLGKQLILKKWS